MKHLLLIPDGMADWPIKEIGNKTPLEYANTPNMDYLADEGACGITKTVPDNFELGSDIANMTILGVDPMKYYTGRGPIEALARDIEAQMVFRCNLVYTEDGIMKDHSGRKIGDEESKEVIGSLNEEAGKGTRFYGGKSYRNLLTIDRDLDQSIKTVPPHDIQGNIEPCVFFPLTAGNIKTDDFEELWEKNEVFAELRNRDLLKPECGSCKYRNYCGGCRARAHACFDDILAPDPGCVNNRVENKL